jgi:hypothetical protein
MIMGLNAYIYKHDGEDYSNNGISARVNQVCLVNVDGPFDPDEEHPAVFLLAGHLNGTARIVPCEAAYAGLQVMADGCYVATSDSRFSEAIEKMLGHRFYGAVPLHDRVE